MTNTALGGLKVLEFAQFVSGPYCAKLLADMGAEVIKIEPPIVGDSARKREPFLDDVPGLERSGFFLFINTSKLGITLDLNTDTGRDIFLRLVADCDVLVEDNPPSFMKERGLDYENLSKINPRLVMTSITPFGQSGPYREYKAYHLNSYHGSGVARVLSSILPKETPVPVKGPGFLGDFDSGLCAATATVAALYGRLFTGEGQHIDISKQEALMALERVEMGMYGNEGETKFSTVFMQQMMGGLQRCKDGYVLITLGGDHHWEGLLKLLGDPVWAGEEKYQGELGKYKYAQEINEHIAEWIKDYTKEDLYHRCQKLNCPIGMVTTVADLAASRQLESREFFGEIEHPVMGQVRCPTSPYRFSETPHRFHRPAPMLGEHNEEIFVDRFGYSREDMMCLRGAGVI
ncbi:MAG: CoA transferase [Proteobacteria bacterium]|jgi:crotonobetainyl-CoA:carnitine CoA-transferase CaiB-like acyl-CoA transferase|nr:CoA transferase [Pseudomonadota bacterium]